MRWTDDELRELVALWPTNSAKQIARRLHRPRSAICGKAKRLRAKGVLPDGVHKHFDVVPVKARPRPVRSTVKKPAPVLNDTVPHLEMQPCPNTPSVGDSTMIVPKPSAGLVELGLKE